MDRRTIIAFILIALIIIFWDDYYRLIYPPPPETAEEVMQPVDTTKAEAQRAAPFQGTHIKPSKDYAIAPLPGEQQIGATVEPPEAIPEREVVVETDRFRARLSSHGARLVSLVLKPNGRYLKREIELLNGGDWGRPGFRFWKVDGPVETADLPFQVIGFEGDNEPRLELGGERTRTVEFRAPFGGDRSLSVIYTFSGSGYSFICEVRCDGMESIWVRDYAEVYWSGGLAYTEADTGQDIWYSRAYLYFSGNVLEKLKINPRKDVVMGPLSGQTRWGAVRTKYFMAALIPELAPATECWMENRVDSAFSGKHHPNQLGVGLRIPIREGEPTTPLRIFIGPLDNDVLASVDPSLQVAMSWGAGLPILDEIIKPLSKLILWGLKQLHRPIPNYGICVIIFSVIIKLVIWPLTRKSYQSMAAMQRLQPKLQALRERFKNDPQRVQKELMKLYKQEGVNPMGGCLPMLIQMPLLYAMFIVFRSTIEFRRAPFALWVKDLSMPDTIFNLPFALPMYGSNVALLPILMGISTFFQSKSTIADPSQKFMLYFMPLFMTLIFNQFPSGLTLYYTLFNIWTLLQQRITPPPRPATAAAEAPAQGR